MKTLGLVYSLIVVFICLSYTKVLGQGCVSQAGLMSSDLIGVCGYDPAESSVLVDSLGNPTFTLDSNDVFEYFLHTSPANSLGTVISHNTNGIFVFQSQMVSGETYYISHVVGDNIGLPGNPLVNLNDTCLSVSHGTPVVWYEVPIADAGIDQVICGEDTYLNASMNSGSGIWLPSQAMIMDYHDPNSATHYGLTGTNDSCWYVWKVTTENNGVQCVSYDTAICVFVIVPWASVEWVPYTSPDFICGITETYNVNSITAQPPGITGSNVISYWISDSAVFYPTIYENDPDSVTALSYGWHSFNWIIENHHEGYVCSDTSEAIYINFVDILTSPIVSNQTSATFPNGAIDLNVTGGVEPYSFEWSDGTSKEDREGLTYGSYIVTVTDYNGCFTIDTIQVNNSISISELSFSEFSNTVLLPNIPNPFSEITEFGFYLTKKTKTEFTVYDVTGVRIETLLDEELMPGKHTISYKSSIAPGTYFYQLKTDTDSFSGKMIITD